MARMIHVTVSGGEERSLSPTAIGRFGIVYAFEFDTQYYGTFVTARTNEANSTFGQVLKTITDQSEVSAVITSIDCKHIQQVTTKTE